MAVIPIPQNILQNGQLETSDILNLYYLLTGVNTYSVAIGTLSVTGAFTLSGAFNANGGLTVPSGQTATVAGTLSVTGSETVASSTMTTLDVTGSATVPSATASGQAVAYQQVTQKISGTVQNPIGVSNLVNGTQVSMTTGSFTAPSNGNLVIIAYGTSTTNTANNLTLTASLAGISVIFSAANATLLSSFAVLPMKAAQSSTVSATMAQATSGYLTGSISAFFQPTP